MLAKINHSVINKLSPNSKPYEVRDIDIKGFLLRVQPSGSMTFYFQYRTTDGRRSRLRLGQYPGVTPAAARKAAQQCAADVVKGGDPHQDKKQKRAIRAKKQFETLGGFIQHKYSEWALSHHRRGKETLILIQGNFSKLYNKQLGDITSWDIQKWISERKKKGFKAATINRRVSTLKGVLSKAVQWGVIQSNPLAQIKPLKIDSKPRVRFLSAIEESRLREAMDKREARIRKNRLSGNFWREQRGYDKLPEKTAGFCDHIKPMVLLALNTGMRKGELFNLKWSDIDLNLKLLTVEGRTAKSSNTRHIPLNREASQILKKMYRQNNDGYVFKNSKTGEKFTDVKKAWSKLKQDARLNNFRFHDLRHSFASKLVAEGVDLYTVKELLGHSTIQMTERYAHLAPGRKAEAVEKLIFKELIH